MVCFGSDKIRRMFLGGDEIFRAYLGDHLVFLLGLYPAEDLYPEENLFPEDDQSLSLIHIYENTRKEAISYADF